MEKMGKLIILFGVVIIVVGIIVWLAGDKLRLLGHLPGDITIKGDNWSVFIPVTTMILASIVLSLVFWVLGKVGR